MKTGYSWKAPASDVSIPCGLTRTLPPSGAPGLPMLENRTYVEVMAAFTPEGRMRPAAICWEDGRVFEIERICGHCRCLCPHNQETARRYTCRIRGRTVYLYYDELCSWYLEKKEGSGKADGGGG